MTLNPTSKTVLKIRREYPSLRGNFIRIADRILQNPALLIQDKVADVAADCGCDNAQIIRFCQKLGFKGFSDLKQAMIHDLIPFRTEADAIGGENPKGFQHLVHDFRSGYQRTINDTAAMFDEELLLQTVAAIRNARKIMICGIGASGIVAEDLQMKLVRLGYPVHFHAEPTTRQMLCSLLDKHDLLVAISFRGENRDVLNCVRVAKENGCRIAAITNFRTSPLAKKSDFLLSTATEEDDFRIGAMTSRISQLLVVDMLTVLLASGNPEKTGLALAKTHTVLHDSMEESK